MGGRIRLAAVTAVFLGVILAAGGGTVLAKTKTVRIDLRGGCTPNERPIGVEKAERVTVRCSRKSIVKVQYRRGGKGKRIVFTGKKKGTAKVTVRCYLKNNRTKTYKYSVEVYKSKKVTKKDLARKAFKLQNRCRKEKGVRLK